MSAPHRPGVLPGCERAAVKTVIIKPSDVKRLTYCGGVAPKVSVTPSQCPELCGKPTPLDSPFNSGVKRAFDILFSLLFLLISPVIFIPVAVAVKLTSPGPVFFRQKRTGYKGKEFTCLKFRTMVVNKDADLLQANQHPSRITRIGKFLRVTSIDEMPQFVNVLAGDMSVVGPRPHMLKLTEDYRGVIKDYMCRHRAKPGITGWAQVSGLRGPMDDVSRMEQRVSHDLWYIDNWSFALDMKIIMRTLGCVFRQR